MTHAEVLVQELPLLRSSPSGCADLSVLLRELLLQLCLAARFPPQGGEKPAAAHGNVSRHEGRQLLFPVRNRGQRENEILPLHV